MTPRKRAASDVLDLDHVVDELYGLPVEEFIHARTAHEKQARASGDRDLADRIKGLAKPNQAAWLINQLVRRHRGELAPLLELGADLREATRTLAGDQLRALSRQQRELTAALVQQARALGREAGMAVSEATARGVQETLHAAMVDDSAADEMLAGRLTAPLARSGFGTDSVATTPKPARGRPAAHKTAQKATQTAEQTAEQRKAERQARVEAQRALAAATRARDTAQSALAHAAQQADDHDAEVARLKDALATAAGSAAEARKRVRACETALKKAERSVADAARRVPG